MHKRDPIILSTKHSHIVFSRMQEILFFYCDAHYLELHTDGCLDSIFFPRKRSNRPKFSSTTSSGIQKPAITVIKVSVPGDLDLHLLVSRDPAKSYYAFPHSPSRAELIEEQKRISR